MDTSLAVCGHSIMQFYFHVINDISVWLVPMCGAHMKPVLVKNRRLSMFKFVAQKKKNRMGLGSQSESLVLGTVPDDNHREWNRKDLMSGRIPRFHIYYM